MKHKAIAAIAAALTASLLLTACNSPKEEVSAGRLDAIKKAGKITMATSPDYAPYEFIDVTKTGQESFAGADIELGKYIALKLGAELVIEAMDFTAAQGAVTSGKVDMSISGYAYTDERAESMELSIFYNLDRTDKQQGVLIRKEDADKYKTAEDFAGKKVAVQNASLQYNLLAKHVPEAEVELVADLKDAVMMLITKKVDAVGVSTKNGEAFSKNYSDVQMSSFYYDRADEGTVVAVTKGETELIEKINEILAEVNDKDLYSDWLEDAQTLAAAMALSE